ncbi:hypothetical protein ABZ869_13150 [Streptomyces sp. NPDC046928]|uniref:hypothetical protein n=1 Tax=Streptomyces sp. NPDC046928 TaxID=3155021 RepID=UPI0033F99C1C
MVEMLQPELAQLVLFGLQLTSHVPAHRFTESHAEELRRAVDVKGEPVTADIWERSSCAPVTRSDDAESKAAGEGTDPVVQPQAPNLPDSDELSMRTEALREEAAELAEQLEAFAASVREGRQPDGPEALVRAVMSWMRERQFLTEAFAKAVPAVAEDDERSGLWGPDAGWLAAAALTERLRKEERERKQVAQKIAEVVQARDEAVGLLEQAVSDLMRQTLVDQVAQFDRKLRELRGDPVTDTTSSEAESDSSTDARADRVSPDEGDGETDPGADPPSFTGPAPSDRPLGPEDEAHSPGTDREGRGQGGIPASQDGEAGDSRRAETPRNPSRHRRLRPQPPALSPEPSSEPTRRRPRTPAPPKSGWSPLPPDPASPGMI